jgi:hypothetical protein
MLALRSAYLLALIVWLGGIMVLGALVAPAAFMVLAGLTPDGRALAAELFGVIVARFHYVEYGAAVVMLASLGAMRLLGPKPAHVAVRAGIIAVMLGVALYSGLAVVGGLEALQADIGMLPSLLPAADPRRLEFDALHQLSERLMLVDLAGALALLYWEVRE